MKDSYLPEILLILAAIFLISSFVLDVIGPTEDLTFICRETGLEECGEGFRINEIQTAEGNDNNIPLNMIAGSLILLGFAILYNKAPNLVKSVDFLSKDSQSSFPLSFPSTLLAGLMTSIAILDINSTIDDVNQIGQDFLGINLVQLEIGGYSLIIAMLCAFGSGGLGLYQYYTKTSPEKLQTQKIDLRCRSCNAENATTAIYCSECGIYLESSEAKLYPNVDKTKLR